MSPSDPQVRRAIGKERHQGNGTTGEKQIGNGLYQETGTYCKRQVYVQENERALMGRLVALDGELNR